MFGSVLINFVKICIYFILLFNIALRSGMGHKMQNDDPQYSNPNKYNSLNKK